MRGFQPAQRATQSQQPRAGRVRGPGTGTSDEVADTVPEGTYIMPTDSTQAIGEQNLAAMGQKPVPVQLSNGEFKLPPEQVHAVGVQALDQMKDATHAPVPAAGPRGLRGFEQNLPGEPRQFFNGGGVVEEAGHKLAPYVNHRPYQGPSAIPPQPQLETNVKPSTAVATQPYRPNFTMGGGNTPPVRPEGPDVADVRAKFDPSKASPEAQSWLKQRAASPGPVAAGPSAPASPVSPVGSAANAAPSGQGMAYQVGKGVGQAAGPAKDWAIGQRPQLPDDAGLVQKAKGFGGQAARGLGRAVGAYGLANTVHDNVNALADVNRQHGVVSPEFAAGAVELVGNTLASGVTNLSSKFPVVGPMVAATVGDNVASRGIRALGGESVLINDGGLGGGNMDAQAAEVPAASPASSVTPAGAGRGSVNPPLVNPSLPPPVQEPSATEVQPGVFRTGNSFSDSAAGAVAGAQPRGLPNWQNDAAAQALAQRSQQGSLMTPQVRGFPMPQQMRAPTVAHSGNDFTARQRLRGLEMAAKGIHRTGKERRQAQAAYQRGQGEDLAAMTTGQAGAEVEAMRANSHLAGEQMRQAGATERAGMQEAGANARDARRAGMDNRKMNLEEQVRGFDVRSGERQENMYRRYDAAKTPEERMAIAQQIRDFSGKSEQANRYTVVPGGQEWDTTANVMRNVPGRVLNNQTGQFVQGGGQSSAPAAAPQDASQRVIGQTYTGPSGKTATWTASGWVQKG